MKDCKKYSIILKRDMFIISQFVFHCDILSSSIVWIVKFREKDDKNKMSIYLQNRKLLYSNDFNPNFRDSHFIQYIIIYSIKSWYII